MHFWQTRNISVIFLYCNLIGLAFVWGVCDGADGDFVIDLPESHLPYYFNKFPHMTEQCLSNSSCIHRKLLASADYDRKKCWGYERICDLQRHSFSQPTCAEEQPAWLKTHDEYVKTFYYQADFGEYFACFHYDCTKNCKYRLFHRFAFRLHSNPNK